MSTKNSSDTIGNRTHDFPTCSAMPQPTALPRAPHSWNTLIFYNKLNYSNRFCCCYTLTEDFSLRMVEYFGILWNIITHINHVRMHICIDYKFRSSTTGITTFVHCSANPHSWTKWCSGVQRSSVPLDLLMQHPAVQLIIAALLLCSVTQYWWIY
jgi:hypothetical protein